MPIVGRVGIAHTRWATHGVPSERNAHPHVSRDGLAIVHNGIIENYEELREDLKPSGYQFSSETDTEVVAHRVHFHLAKLGDLFKAVRATVAELEGAYALAVVSEGDPDRIIVARMGCPVVLGLGVERELRRLRRRRAAAGDASLHVPRRGRRGRDPAQRRARDRSRGQHRRPADQGERAVGRRRREGPVPALHAQGDSRAAARRRPTRCRSASPTAACWKPPSDRRRRAVFERVEAVHIVACGTSYHAGVVARYMIEQICRIPCRVEIASEYRYRNPVVPKNALFVVDLAVGRDRRYAGGAAHGAPATATCRRWRSATRPRVRWCANPNW